MLLVAKIEESAAYAGVRYDLGANRWSDGSLSPRGYRFVDEFARDGTTPVWRFAFGDAVLEKRIWMERGANTTYVRYVHVRGTRPIDLDLRAFANYRDFHGNTHAGDWRMDVAPIPGGVRVAAYDGARPFYVRVDRGVVAVEHIWYRDFLLVRESERGLDDRDDELAVATFRARLAPGESLTAIASDVAPEAVPIDGEAARVRRVARDDEIVAMWRAAQPEAPAAPPWLERCVLAADQFIVARPIANDPLAVTVIAGYPWFGDWGRDTMIALPGLALATGRSEIARKILLTFAAFVEDGLLPNYFPDGGDTPAYNTVDAALWFVEAVGAYVDATGDDATLRALFPTLAGVIAAYARGTRYGIALDPHDGLIAAGEPGMQLTWMDAKVGDWVVTPRIGKPVEIAALWHNALERMARLARRAGEASAPYEALAERARMGFERFWNVERGCCFDVLDGPDGNDASIRPNQLFAIALPFSPLDARRQRAIVTLCGERLFAGTGVRTLDPSDPRYIGTYGGTPRERDAAYHQGTSWLYLLGIFASAYARAFSDAAGARAFLDAYDDASRDGGLGTLGELADGDAPFTPRGTLAQAWSVATAIAAWHDAPQRARS